MSCNPDDSDTIKLGEFIILELFRDSPWDQVTAGPHAPLELFVNVLLADFSFESDLDRDQDIWQLASFCWLFQWPQ